MSTIFEHDYERFSVVEARADQERLEELNIRSPDVSKMFRLRIDKHTMMFFHDIGHRGLFVDKYYNRKTKRFIFEKKTSTDEDHLLNE